MTEAAGTGAETYTVTLYSDSDRTTVTASTTIQVNDNGQPVPPDLNIAAISDIVKDYSTGASHAVTVSSGNAVDVYSTFFKLRHFLCHAARKLYFSRKIEFSLLTTTV